MESLFKKNPGERPPPSVYEKIGPEIAHLKKSSSVRNKAGAKKALPLFTFLILCALLWLYAMDPVLYSIHKAEAIRAYLYLHSFGSGPTVNALANCGYFSENEIEVLNHKQGSFQDYFANLEQANQQAVTVENYMKAVRDLHDGKYQDLDPIGKIRCILFIRCYIPLPTEWSFLNPSVQ